MTIPPASIGSDLAPTGTLRASINLGNPVLAHGTAAAPAGVTVDIAHEIGRRLGMDVELVCFDAARKSFEAMAGGRADICFLAIEPAREAEVAFTAPYVLIEGVYAVPRESPFTTPADVDRRRRADRREARVRLRPVPHPHPPARQRGARGGGGRRVPCPGTGGGRRHQAADDRVRRGQPRRPPDRRSVHADPAGAGDDQDAPTRDRRGTSATSSRS